MILSWFRPLSSLFPALLIRRPELCNERPTLRRVRCADDAAAAECHPHGTQDHCTDGALSSLCMPSCGAPSRSGVATALRPSPQRFLRCSPGAHCTSPRDTGSGARAATPGLQGLALAHGLHRRPPSPGTWVGLPGDRRGAGGHHRGRTPSRATGTLSARWS